MIELWAIKAWRLIKLVPREVWYGIAAYLAFQIVTGHYYDKGYEARTAEYVALIEEAQEKAIVGGLKAEQAAKATVTAIEAENARAVEAASNSDDPLKAALDAL